MPGDLRQWMVGSMFVLALGVSGAAQEPPREPQQRPARPPADMSAKCKAMMAEHDKVVAELRTADERLDQLVTKMNAASGEAKVDATAAVVAEMVTQRRKMRDRMMGMQEGTMSHMMEHVQAGPKSMADCPMMKPGGAMR